MLHTFAQNELIQILDRGILDPKTRYLLLVGFYMMTSHWDGVLPQACNAKAAGATDEEIMEVAFCVCYSVGKAKMQESGECLDKVFKNDMYKSIAALKK
jgi:alkylhydroperoxidase/carboxymuconolactone decarboxylase family protein YurZ